MLQKRKRESPERGLSLSLIMDPRAQQRSLSPLAEDAGERPHLRLAWIKTYP